MQRGYVKLWRKATDSDLFAFDDLRLPGLFAWLLLRANWRAGTWRGHEIPAGASVQTVAGLAERFGTTHKVMRGLLSRLVDLDMLTVQSLGNRASMVTITNWSDYQSPGQTEGKPNESGRANHGQTEGPGAPMGYDAGGHVPGQTEGKPNESGRANRGQTPRRKEREEENTPPIVPPAPNGSGKPSPGSEIVERIPLKGGGVHEVTRADVAELERTFPGVDVEAKLRHCAQWNRDDPSRRKTARGVRKHITGWIARPEFGGGRGQNGRGGLAPGQVYRTQELLPMAEA